ncbi:MAG TPA: hypothetical protein PLA43_18790 [Bryobacteraceae bacterium]|nr:hypothetical protein [Bryobacteraceae bacterium]
MKHLAVFLLAASGMMAADFGTGQAARAVIGQPTFTAQLPDSSDVVLGGVGGVAYANGKLFVTDANRVAATPINHRVLIFNVSEFLPRPDAEIPQTDPPSRCPLCVGKASVVLGQEDFTGSEWHIGPSGMRLPTAVASDGIRLAVADTDNNRILIWNSIPTTNNAPADIVIGQPDFNSTAPNAGTGDSRVPSPRSLRSPQGVWIQDGRLFVADTLNKRVLIWNSFPTENFQPADVVLGQPDFYTAIEPDIQASAKTLLDPVSVTSDGVRLFVSDLGHHRVLIWNSIPTTNQQPADVVVGQPNMTSAVANYSHTFKVDETGKIIERTKVLCDPDGGKDDNGLPTYPARCAATLEYPRFALSDGTRLFIADGGNDRILVFNRIPTTNGEAADVVLGQINDHLTQTSDNPDNPDVERRASTDSVRTPTSLAWDGENLYVSEPFSRRVLVFTVGGPILPLTAVRNAASLDVFAVGSITLGGEIQENDEITIKIRDKEYKYKVKKDDTFELIIRELVNLINAGDGDPWVLATENPTLLAVNLTSRVGGKLGDETEISASVSPDTARITARASGNTLGGGGFAAKLAPGSLISIFGNDLAETTMAAPPDADPLPSELGGVRVYVDGRAAPIIAVSPTQINAQLPFEVLDATSVSVYVRTQRSDGTVTNTTAIGVPIIPANPGVFTYGGTDPRPAVAMHGSSHATGTIYIEGTAKEGDEITVTIEDRTYKYKLTADDTLESARDRLIELINTDPQVFAIPSTHHRYIRLRARVQGPAGNGIRFSATADGGNVVVGGTNSRLCCANVEGALITEDNPAVPGENIIIYATGLGMVHPDEAKFATYTGYTYKGPFSNAPDEFVSAMVGGKTANVLAAGMKPGTVGIYEVHLELNSDLPTNPLTQLTIAQDIYVSNIATIPLWNPNEQANPLQ